jgi:hypothetical protein
MLLEFKHTVSQKSVIREMDYDELKDALKKETNPKMVEFIREQMRQIVGKVDLYKKRKI